MWRSFRVAVKKSDKISATKLQCRNSSSNPSGGSGGKLFVGAVGIAGAGLAGAVIYGKYDSNFRKILEDNVPYIDSIYKLFPDEDKKPSLVTKKVSEEKPKDPAASSSLLRKKLDREKAAAAAEAQKASHIEPRKNTTSGAPVNDSKISETNVKLESQTNDQNLTLLEKQESESASDEKVVSQLIERLERNTTETLALYQSAISAIKLHTQTLYEALDLPDGNDNDIVWKEVNKTNSEKSNALKFAEEKASETRAMVESLKENINRISRQNSRSPVLKPAEESIKYAAQKLQDAFAEVSAVETHAKTAAEYEKLVNKSKEQFRRELEVVLPNYIYGDKSKASEQDLNMLIAHAHRRIEQLQKQLARQQVSEKLKVEEALNKQKMQDNKSNEDIVKSELEKRKMDLESAVSERVAFLKDNFEKELRKQLGRQAAAHADHIQEVLKVREQELERKYSLDLEEKLLHQKGVFISEVSGNMARLKGILAYLKAKGDFDEASKKSQALWLACQSMSSKIEADNGGELHPLAKDIAAVKIAADEDTEFIHSILSSIPAEAVNRGVYNSEILKQRFFNDVKKVCRRVALIDENNDSLYRYMLSYIQSALLVDVVSIPKEERDGKVAVDPSQWDTFDLISRVSYCLQTNDLEQALRYANQFKGEPRVVAKDWMKEVRLLLETQLAVKALLAHAAAVSVQAYH